MIIDGLNIIIGYCGKGKTSLLLSLANILYESDNKICFIGGYDTKYPTRLFEYTFLEVSDFRTFQLIQQISDRYDYILIDDVNRIKKEYIDILLSINKVTIVTLSLKSDSDESNRPLYYDIANISIENNKSWKVFTVDDDMLEFDNRYITTSDFLKPIKRDYKINYLLK